MAKLAEAICCVALNDDPIAAWRRNKALHSRTHYVNGQRFQALHYQALWYRPDDQFPPTIMSGPAAARPPRTASPATPISLIEPYHAA